jgi:integrase
MALTDVAIRKSKPAEKSYKLTDGGGLHLVVTPSGGKLWRLKYRHLGAEKLLSIGPYPTVSLAEARDRREEAKKQILALQDPAQAKKDAKRAVIEAAAQTFGLIAEEHLARLGGKGRAAVTVKKNRWLLFDIAAPLTDRPISQITTAEVLAVLSPVAARGRLETTRRARAAIGSVFRLAIRSSRATVDPSAALVDAFDTPTVKNRAALTKSADVGELLRAIEGMEGSPVVKPALQIMALCFPRPGELRLARWSEIDLDKAVWSLPADRTKMRTAHEIPLSPQAVAIFRDLHKLSGKGPLAFPGMRRSVVPLSENTLNAALRRLGFDGEQMSAHGFRTIASTLLNESGLWHADAIEHALAHQHGNKVRRAYARGQYWEERVKMAAWWADHLDELREKRPLP